MPHLIFNRASSISNPKEMTLNPDNLELLSSVLNSWEGGYLYLMEGPNMKGIHRDIHWVMFQASISGWETTLIDAANCFNPQLLDSYAQQNSVETSDILQSIQISRPFQMFQAASIVDKVYQQLSGEAGKIIVVTRFPSMFYDPSASEAQDSGLTTGELFHHSVGLLQRLAHKGNVVILTEKAQTPEDTKLGFAVNVHIRFDQVGTEYTTAQLLSHPTYPGRTAKQKMQKPKKSIHQLSLEDFF